MSTTDLKASIEPVIAAVETVVLADVAALAPRAELTFMQFVKENRTQVICGVVSCIILALAFGLSRHHV
jgi:hypothetical protein